MLPRRACHTPFTIAGCPYRATIEAERAMDRTKRIFLLHNLFSCQRQGMTIQRMMDLGECERATLYRDLAYLKDELGAPLEHDGGVPRCYFYAHHHFQLPTLWMDPAQLYGLAMAEKVFQLSGATPLQERVSAVRPSAGKLLLGNLHELRRLRIMRCRGRHVDGPIFQLVSQALFERTQLRFRYKSRTSDKDYDRVVSPQLLTYHRDNWYLDALHHRSDRLFTFSLDRICDPRPLDLRAIDVPDPRLEEHLAKGYGIFSGPIIDIAWIRFTTHAAQWVENETWHDDQTMHWQADGSLDLRLPYSHPRELVMEIMRFGRQAQIIGPEDLRQEIKEELREASGQYGG